MIGWDICHLPQVVLKIIKDGDLLSSSSHLLQYVRTSTVKKRSLPSI